MDRAVLYAELDRDVRGLADELGLPEAAASAVLRHHGYRGDAAAEAFRSDPGGTLGLCGVRSRCGWGSATAAGYRSAGGGAAAEEGEAASGGGAEAAAAGRASCGICLDDDVTSYSMPCGHPFCRGCWRSYLDVAFGEGGGRVLDLTCPREGCGERVTEADVADVAPDLTEEWRDRRFESYVDLDGRRRFCPGPGCGMVAVSPGADPPPGKAAAAAATTCVGCATSFCFGCGEAPHRPAGCGDLRRWGGIFASSGLWVRRNSRPCPGCGAPIEKATGCNHMRCTRCDCHFCWVCLTVIGTDGVLNTHVCNKYEPAADDATEEGRNIFYVTRFEAHDEAEKFAKTQIDAMPATLDELAEELPFLDDDDFHVIKKAGDILLDSRRFLKYSYVVAYCMPDGATTAPAPAPAPPQNGQKGGQASTREGGRTAPASARGVPADGTGKEAFVTHQATLERFTEKLSGMIEADLAGLLRLRGERALRMHLRAIDFHAQCIDKYMERIGSFLGSP